MFSRTARKKRNSEAIQTLAKTKGKMESQRKHFSSLSAFTDVAISINIPSCNLSVTSLKSIFLQEKVGGCSMELFSACPFPQDMDNVSEQQLIAVTAGKEGAGVPADRGQAAGGRVWRESKGFLWMISTLFHTC